MEMIPYKPCLSAFFVIAILIFGNAYYIYADDLQKFINATLIQDPSNDGDSFYVSAGDKDIHIRLYYVDCPEISVVSETDARQVREQSRYFGLSNYIQTVYFGKKAKEKTEQLLSKPFTIYTSFANAMGRSSKGRVYGFITTGDEGDLAAYLIKNGLARTHGVGRETPDGVPRDEMIQRLRDLETSAMLKRTGIWEDSDPDRIAELRAEQRSEENKLKEIQEEVKQAEQTNQLIDLNTASKEELESIPGIGPTLASRIIEGRPYKTIDELLKIKGIGAKTFAKIQPYLSALN